MSEPVAAAVSSTRDQREKTVPVVTVESFYDSHAAKLQMKLEGPRVGFHRKIREPTINRPGLALSGFYTYFAEKRVQVLGAAEHSYLKSLTLKVRAQDPLSGDIARVSPRTRVAGSDRGGRDRGVPHTDDYDEVYQRGHDRAR